MQMNGETGIFQYHGEHLSLVSLSTNRLQRCHLNEKIVLWHLNETLADANDDWEGTKSIHLEGQLMQRINV